MAVLPTGFGKTIIYERFVLLEDTGDSNQTPSIMVIVPRSSDSVKRLSMGSCLREKGEVVKEHHFKQVLSRPI